MEMRGSFGEVSPPGRVVSTERWGPEWPETQTGMKDGADQSYARMERYLATLA